MRRNVKSNKEKGFSHILVLIAVFSTILISFAGYRVYSTTLNSVQKDNADTVKKNINKPQPSNQLKEQPVVEEPPAPVSSAPKSTPAQNTPVIQPKVPEITATTPKPVPVIAPTFSTSIKIIGDAACQSTTVDALKLLSTNAPTHYSTVTKYISVIECASQGSGMFAYENPPRFLVGDATRNAGTVWYAGTIAHDAGHSKLYNDYLAANNGQAVPSDVWTGEAAERSCLDAQFDVLSKIGGTQSQLDYIQNVINTQYYNVSYDQRWW